MKPQFAKGALMLAACMVFFAAAVTVGRAASAGYETLNGTVRLPKADGVTISYGRIVRQLTQAELSETLRFSVTLKMRDFQALQTRVSAGQQVADSEMEASYLPLKADYDRVSAWLAAQGFTSTMTDGTHTALFVQGTVAQVASTFGIAFARVAVSDGEYTSAIEAPRIPAALAPVILSVNGLQPEFRPRLIRSQALSPQDVYGQGVYVTPDNLASAYNIPASATGAGQTIAIVGEGAIATSDLTSFWTATGSSDSLSHFTSINVNGGPGISPQAGATQEADLDVQWASAVAPGAAIRLYLSSDLYGCYTQIVNDHASIPGLTALSISYGDTEGDQNEDPPDLQAQRQIFTQMSAAGISVFASSGDSGSNPKPGAGAGSYSTSNPLAVNYPASDPNVTGVGGSDIQYTGTWTYTGELVWSDLTHGSASGGGVSILFPKPSWQTGGSVLSSQTARCVPDVAAMSVADLSSVNLGSKFQPYSGDGVGVLVFVGGSPVDLVGTSLSSPIWAGVAALINQARAANGISPVGLMGPVLYPLQGTSAFNDITSGTNGAYNAGPGYDLCSGLGSPNVGNLISVLSGATRASQRLLDISNRAQVQTGQNIVIGGFVIGGSGASKSVLVRSVGPGLATYGVTGVLSQPSVSVYDSSGLVIATDTGWSNLPTAGNSTVAASFRQATAADMSSAGAFPLSANSPDSAIVLTLPPGAYSAQSSGVGGTSGVALTEVYDLSPSAPQTLVNIAARCFVGTGASIAISGMVISGNTSAQVLIRGVGPTLSQYGITGALAQPSITLEDSSGTNIVSDTGWGNQLVVGTSTVAASYRLATAADMTKAGAFSLNPGTADSAMVVTLPPGTYTVELSGVGSSSGTGLAEIYQLSIQ
jgi:kumamolisin